MRDHKQAHTTYYPTPSSRTSPPHIQANLQAVLKKIYPLLECVLLILELLKLLNYMKDATLEAIEA
jgi:hypothetical protein